MEFIDNIPSSPIAQAQLFSTFEVQQHDTPSYMNGKFYYDCNKTQHSSEEGLSRHYILEILNNYSPHDGLIS